ncbi:hypothetical protein [Nocardia sp. NPDC050793]|uniref:hypothetical protein n=1 Tax=Nocardia sp. NPDC050793 TaxID=3155159 RepID=UPI0033EE97C2
MPDQTAIQTPLQKALAEACAFALAHGVEGPLRPSDFGIQRSDAGVTNATYVDASHAVTAFVDHHGNVRFAVAELYWVHNESDEDREPCGNCGECANCGEVECECEPSYRPRPETVVYLPGDAPAEVSAHV